VRAAKDPWKKNVALMFASSRAFKIMLVVSCSLHEQQE
jgi:hypothetical protein